MLLNGYLPFCLSMQIPVTPLLTATFQFFVTTRYTSAIIVLTQSSLSSAAKTFAIHPSALPNTIAIQHATGHWPAP
jgi:hypothetical protein